MGRSVKSLALKISKKIAFYLDSIRRYVKLYTTLLAEDSPKIVIFNTPFHNNLGDHAIALAEIKLIREHFPGMNFIEINGRELAGSLWGLKKVVKKNDIVAINGGGNMGSMWIYEEQRIRKVLKTFHDRKIIIFPQTVFYGSDRFGLKQLKKSKPIYGKCINLTIFARETTSEHLLREFFPDCKVLLAPEMALYLDINGYAVERNGVLLCLRSDKEKTLDTGSTESILEAANSMTGIYHYTDMLDENAVTKYNRNDAITNKLNEFAQAKLIITDRLHGMVFAILACTPCVVIESKSHKIAGVYNWIRDMETVQLINDVKDLQSAIGRAMSAENPSNALADLKRFYKPVVDELRNAVQ